MEKLTNEGIIESGLPFLNDGHFETAIVGSFCVYCDWRPNIQVVMFPPIAKCELSLDKSFVGELKILPRTTVLPVESMMHCRANVEFWLHVRDVGETKLNEDRRYETERMAWKRGCGYEVWSPTGV